MTPADQTLASKQTSGVFEAPTVTLPWAAAYFLCRQLPVEELVREVRGAQPTLDRAFRDLLLAARLFAEDPRTSADGSSSAPTAEVQSESKNDEIGTSEAAGILDISTRAVRLGLEEGRLPGELVAGRWRMRRSDIEAVA